MSRENTQKVVQDFYAARLSNSADATAAYFDHDGIFEMAGGASGAPIVTTRDCPGECHDTVKAVVAQWEWRDQDILSTVIEGDNAAVYYRLRAAYAPTGVAVDTQLCDMLTIKDGKIAELIEFVDTALVATLTA